MITIKVDDWHITPREYFRQFRDTFGHSFRTPRAASVTTLRLHTLTNNHLYIIVIAVARATSHGENCQDNNST